MALFEKRGRIRAVLGPTNTGKTYLAMDRMLGHSSGMIGFPLRLLARENYDRIVALKGRRSVALITGEEKIIPPRPRWFRDQARQRAVAHRGRGGWQTAAPTRRGDRPTN